jgi:alpha-glucosidase
MLYNTDLPEVQPIVAEMRRVVDAFSDARSSRVLIGELYLPLTRLVAYYGFNAEGVLEGVQLPFNFQLIATEWQAAHIDRFVRDYEAALPAGAQPNWVLGNHDKIAHREPRRATDGAARGHAAAHAARHADALLRRRDRHDGRPHSRR